MVEGSCGVLKGYEKGWFDGGLETLKLGFQGVLRGFIGPGRSLTIAPSGESGGFRGSSCKAGRHI